jgi:RNA polymerase sigma-70 factor (ECF subfamily)
VIGDADEASDAAQDAFIRAWRYLAKFRGDCTFSSWLSRIAVNVARDAAKKRGKAPRDFSSMETPDGAEFDPISEHPAPGDSLLQHERQRAVRRALALVPEHFRVVLVLFDLQGRSYEECAAALELPMGTIKSRLSRARAALRDALGDDRELFGA